MTKPTLTDLYIQEVTEEYVPLNDREIEWHYKRYMEYKDETSRNALFLSTMPLILWLIKVKDIGEDMKDDCIQAGNVAILEAIETWHPDRGSSFATWIRNQANREITREVNRIKSCGGVDISDWMETEMVNDRNEELELEAEVMLLKAGITGLPDRQRLLLRYTQQGMSVANAGDRMGITRQAAGRLYAKAVKNLRKYF